MSKRNDILIDIQKKLKSIENVEVKLNSSLPEEIPQTGLIMVRDGGIVNEEIYLSPLFYKYQLKVLIEIITSDGENSLIDNLLDKIGDIFDNDKTISGLADYIHFEPPEYEEVKVEGTAPLKGAVLTLLIEYGSKKLIN